ncbi:MAG: DUF6265 family protein [Hyphococcus sp.]
MQMIAMAAAVWCAAALAARAGDDVPVRTLPESAASPAATLEDIDWLVGYWVGGSGGEAAELFAPAAGGQMMGVFRLMTSDGAPQFYEFYLIAEENDSLVLRIKHFTPAMVGWEEKDGYVEFPLVGLGERAAYFDGLTFAMTGDDAMQAAVIVNDGEIARFDYRRRALE